MRLSTGVINKLLDTSSLKEMFDDCVIDIYSGSQPLSADNAPNGAVLATVSNASGPVTPGVTATGSFTLSGASGSVTGVTVNGIDVLGGAVSFVTDIATTAAAVALQINRNPQNALFVATSSGAVVTLTGVNGLGALCNGWVVAATSVTLTVGSYVAMTGGVNAVNCLRWDMSAAGVISKLATQTWSGNGQISGTAGWFRIRLPSDSGATSTTSAVRIDGNIGTSGADMNLGSLMVTVGAPFILSTAAISLPSQ